MTRKRKLFLRILHIACFITDEPGFDELQIILNDEKIWPKNHKFKSVNKGLIKVNTEIRDLDPDTHLDLEVWDYDYLSSNDLLGKFPIYIDEPGGPYTTDMIPNSLETQKAKYSITWEIDYEN
jgi:hypothetical protein